MRQDELREALMSARRQLDALIDSTGVYESPEHDRLNKLILELREELYGILEE